LAAGVVVVASADFLATGVLSGSGNLLLHTE
jgi:hypothetical protein